MNFTLGEPRVLGVYVDNGISYVSEMDKNSRNPIVYKYFTVPTPDEMVRDDGCVECTEKFRQDFIAACKQHKVVADKIIFTVNSGRIINRELLIPYVSNNKVGTVIQSNATEYFPVDISDHKVVHKVLQTVVDETGKHLKVNVCAVPRDILRSYYDLADYLGFQVETLDYLGNSIYQCIKVYDKPKTETEHNVNMYIAMDSSTTSLIFVHNHEIKLQRQFNIGYGRMLSAAAEVARVNQDTLLHGKNGFDINNPPNDDDLFNIRYDKESWQNANLDYVDEIIPAIIRNMEYFLSRPEYSNLDVSTYLVGPACRFGGLREYLSEGLETEVMIPELVLKKNSLKYVNPDELDVAEFVYSIGAAVMPLNITDKSIIKSVPMLDVFKDSSVQKLCLLIGMTVFAVCVGVAVSLWFIPQSDNAALQKKANDLKLQIAGYGNVNSVYSEYENWKKVKESVTKIDNYLYTYNDNLVYFIEEFERKMPESFTAKSINISETGVSMSIVVGSRSEAAFTIMTLREMKSVKITAISPSFSFTAGSAGDPTQYVVISDENYNVIASNLGSVDWLTFDLTTLDPAVFAYFGIDMTKYVDKDGNLIHENLNPLYKDMSDEDIRKGLDDGSIDFFNLCLIKKQSEVLPEQGGDDQILTAFSVSLEFTGDFEKPEDVTVVTPAN